MGSAEAWEGSGRGVADGVSLLLDGERSLGGWSSESHGTVEIAGSATDCPDLGWVMKRVTTDGRFEFDIQVQSDAHSALFLWAEAVWEGWEVHRRQSQGRGRQSGAVSQSSSGGAKDWCPGLGSDHRAISPPQGRGGSAVDNETSVRGGGGNMVFGGRDGDTGAGGGRGWRDRQQRFQWRPGDLERTAQMAEGAASIPGPRYMP